jgi:uncharacterized protein YjbI with pentapeptide repeats
MTTDAEDRSTWPRNRQVIRRAELLRLIEENGGPEGLDLRGAIFVGEGASDDPEENPIDLRPEALRPYVESYTQDHEAEARPPWLAARRVRGREPGISLGGAHLENASLEGAHLEDAYLWRAHLENAYLWRAHLRNALACDAHLESAHVPEAHLENADLLGAHLEGAYLSGTHLENARLWGAHLENALVQGAELEKADLGFAHLQNADLLGAHLENADLGRAHLEKANLQDADLEKGAFWYGCHLERTRVRRESLGQAVGEEMAAHKEKTADAYHRAKEAYLLLKNNFNQIGRYEDASWAYVKEQQMEKMAYYREWRSQGWRIWRAWSSFWRWLRNWAYELTTGYGERPWNAVLCGLGAVLAFAVGFWATAVMGGRGLAAFFDSLVYSVSAFATFNLARPGLNPEGRGVEIFSSLEAILGIGVLALVVFTLGNRMSRG